jgi:hypothetical protein
MSVQLLANPAHTRRPLIPAHNRIGLSRAEYVGVGVTLFDQVADGRLPEPKLANSRKLWHREGSPRRLPSGPKTGRVRSAASLQAPHQ